MQRREPPRRGDAGRPVGLVAPLGSKERAAQDLDRPDLARNGACARGRLVRLVTRFVDKNRELSDAIVPHLPQAKLNLHEAYVDTVARYMNALPGGVVVDVGGGRKCDFASARRAGSRVRIVAVDISTEELALNQDVDEKRLADITKELPFAAGEVDLVVSRSVIEHLRESEAFVANSARVLKSGGHFIHVFPSKFAPFSILNQLLPRRLSQTLLHTFHPGSEGRLGFPAYYDQTYVAAMRRMLPRCGFDTVDLRVGYYQAEYFDFCLPLFLVNAAYELIVSALKLENLAAVVLVVARKR